ncbi:MAG: hypothetical protein ACOWWM_10095 [Desulfobacterales bacterium]
MFGDYKRRFSQRHYLAFVHIEKAAGTTLIHLLRKNLFPGYMDVRPVNRRRNHSFGPKDLAAHLCINPLLTGFGGHSVTPYGDLETVFPNLRFITLLRNPVDRYVSQFRYLVRIQRIPDDFEAFLANPHYEDFQTNKLDPSGDPVGAFQTLKNRMLEVGLVEEFDTFLLRLTRKLGADRFDPHYQVRNAARSRESADRLLDRYEDRIVERNRKDSWLYGKVESELIPDLNAEYGPSLASDLGRFQQENLSARTDIKNYADYVLRKAFYEPASGVLRRLNGLPALGSYDCW